MHEEKNNNVVSHHLIYQGHEEYTQQTGAFVLKTKLGLESNEIKGKGEIFQK